MRRIRELNFLLAIQQGALTKLSPGWQPLGRPCVKIGISVRSKNDIKLLGSKQGKTLRGFFSGLFGDGLGTKPCN